MFHMNCCQICQSSAGTTHLVREMMLGTKDEFLYWECSSCGCLSLSEIPNDLGRYYPKNYYSLQAKPSSLSKRMRDTIYLSPLSFLVNWRPRTDMDVIKRIALRKQMRLLDVGCGAGYLVGDLRELGYDARGVDPFIDHDLLDRFGIRVERKTLDEVGGKFDVILFRHSLEHMSPEMLRIAMDRLVPGGVCIVCIPLLGWAWKEYGKDWVQLDAPRHFFLHTPKSFTFLAEKSGFSVEKIVFDSNEFQFWGSEAYRKNVPLLSATKPGRLARLSLRKRASILNRKCQGDMAQFYLRAVGTIDRTTGDRAA